MPRNFFRRVETTFPVVDPELPGRSPRPSSCPLADNVRARALHADGSYERLRPAPGAPAVDAQAALLEDARAGCCARPIDLVARGGAEPPPTSPPSRPGSAEAPSASSRSAGGGIACRRRAAAASASNSARKPSRIASGSGTRPASVATPSETPPA